MRHGQLLLAVEAFDVHVKLEELQQDCFDRNEDSKVVGDDLKDVVLVVYDDWQKHGYVRQIEAVDFVDVLIDQLIGLG